LFSLPEGRVAKPAKTREVRFYTQLTEGLHSAFLPFVPRYFGNIADPLDDSNDKVYIVLEDLTKRFRRPCVLDLKIGTSQCGPDAPEAKKVAQIAKCEATTSKQLGVRLCGMKVWKMDTSDYMVQSKYEGRAVKHEGLRDALEEFFINGVRSRHAVAKCFANKLRAVQEVMLQQTELKFFSSSLLLMYEGDDAGEEESHSMDDSCTVKMIDFANTYFGLDVDTVDEGYLRGLKTTIALLEDIADNTRREHYL
jgi:inositol-hexakisphosphate kinase